MFVGFVLKELLQRWDHVQAFKKVQELDPEANVTHSVIHRCALTSRTLPTALKNVLDSMIKAINYIKSGSLNTSDGSMGGPGWALAGPGFCLAPCLPPPQFFLNVSFKFVWLTYTIDKFRPAIF